MRIFFILIFTSLSFSTNVYSQDSITTGPNKSQIKLHFAAPGLTLEQYLTPSFSINYQLASDFSLFASFGNSDDFELALWPYLSVEPRIYLNSKQNNGSYGKNGKYLAVNSKVGFGTDENIPLISVGPMFGYKIAFDNNFYFDFGLGIGAVYSKQNYTAGIIGNVQLGFILNK